MKILKAKSKFKKIIIYLFIFIICAFAPIISVQATVDGDQDFGGALFKPFSNLLCAIGDTIISALQHLFIDSDDISVGFSDISSEMPVVKAKTYFIEYSPAKIFSGEVAGLDINFINPLGDKDGKKKEIKQTFKWVEKEKLISREALSDYGLNFSEAELSYSNNSGALKRFLWGSQKCIYVYWRNEADGQYYLYIDQVKHEVGTGQSIVLGFWNFVYSIGDLIDKLDNKGTLYEIEVTETEVETTSVAKKIQGTISSWYKDLQVLALVGLLSVLVYMAIKMITSSTASEKSKYKKMLMDWITAVCILFILTYLMAFILNTTQTITNLFNESTLGGKYKEDVLMTRLRNEISCGPENFSTVFSQTLLYVVLVIYTLIFTILYLKRVVYMAFLTMIAPLIALTYPLDKIKDSKAQAFETWLKEYIFNAMIQPVHLILYYILLGSSLKLLDNPIYAVVAIGFLIPAEKFFRKIFKMESGTPVAKLGEMAAGATIMNMIQKAGAKAKKDEKGKKNEEDKSKVHYVRTANSNPYEGIGEQNEGAEVEPVAVPVASSTKGASINSADLAEREVIKKSVTGAKSINNDKTLQGKEQYENMIKFVGEKGSKVLHAGGKLAGIATLGTVGLAATIASGDMSKAFQNAIISAEAGKAAGDRFASAIEDAPKNIQKVVRSIDDRYIEGAFEKEEADNMKYDRDFMQSQEGSRLVRNYSKAEVKACLEAGITDPKQMERILKKVRKDPQKYALKKSIAFSSIAKDCSPDILRDASKFKSYLESKGVNIGEEQAKNIANDIADFIKD